MNWCSSISSHNINNQYQQQVRPSLKVYCGTSTDNSFKVYNSSQTSDVAPKIEADSGRSLAQYRRSLYTFWMQHPSIRDFCCNANTNYHITLLQALYRFENNFYNYIGGLTANVAIELRKELENRCSESLSDPFCPIYAALEAIDVSSRLPADRSTWTQETEQYKQAVLVSFAILKKKFPQVYSGFILDEEGIIVNCTNLILRHIQNKDVDKLETLATYLPSNDAYKATETVCRNDQLCIFMKIVEQARLYLDEARLDTNPVLINGKKRLVLNTAVDYREFLKQKQLDRILTILSEQQSTSIQIANDLKQHTTTKFTELRTYFEKVETFNQQIASADIGYVNGRLEVYQNSVKRIMGKLKRDMADLLHNAFISVGLEIAEKAVILAMEIAEAVNPLKWLTGGGPARDLLEATGDLLNAIAEIVKLAQIKSSLNKLIVKSSDIGEKIERNDNFLQNVKNLIDRKTVSREDFEHSKRKFIQQYTAYDPQVTKPELVEMGALWEILIDSACDVIDSTTSAAAAPVKSYVNNKGYCISLKSQTAKMVSTYEEIYDYQFDLIDTMAAYVRSSVSLDAAEEISSEFTEFTKVDLDSGSTLTTLAIMGGLTYVAFTTHILHAVHLYCNVLEYMEGGILPSECKGVNTDLALLIANKEPVCRSDTTQFYRIPTTMGSVNGSNNGIINIADLIAGDKVTFKVPSADWLVEKKWIRASERNDSFYVKKFEVHLPIIPEYPQKFYSKSEPVLHNEITPGSTEYIIVPDTPLIYEYRMGPSRLGCHFLKFRNPYTSCKTTDISEVCEMSHEIKHPLYPSIYSQWSISVQGEEDMTVPDPATDLDLIISMRLCKIAPANERSGTYSDTAVFQEVQDQCCPEGEYRPSIDSMCTSCPDGSSSALAGYYCERN